MCGGSSTTTQSTTIPPEVLARYNAVNARAEDVAKQPFKQYGGEFVAPINEQQRIGIGGINQAAGMAQGQMTGAQNILNQAYQTSQPYMQQALGTAGSAYTQGQNQLGQAQGYLTNAASQGQIYGGQAYQPIAGALGSAQPYMQTATQLVGGGLGAAAPMMGAAEGYLGGGTQAVNPQEFGQAQINKYMSPYMKNVVEAQQALQQQESAAQRSALNSQAIGAGAFGGDRAGIAQANLARQQSLANQATLGNLLQQGYGQAAGMFQQQQGVNLAAQQANRQAQQFGSQQAANLAQQRYAQQMGAGQQLAALGQQQFGQNIGAGQALAGLGQQMYQQGLGASQAAQGLGQAAYGMGAQQGAFQQGIGSALYGMGTQQATTQAGLAQQQQAAALQGAQAQIGAGTLEQQTRQAEDTARYQQFLQERGYDFQVAQFLANIAMGTGALSGSTTTTTGPNSFFSDRRLKKDIKEIGSTHDGLPIYSFKYKGGDDQQRIGVMADEAREKHPDAVHRVGGIDAVDYEKIANRASEGGGVMPSRAGEGFAEGGHVSAEDLATIIAMQRQFLGPHGQGGLYGQSAQNLPGQKGIVPQASLPVARLSRHAPPPQQQSGVQQAMAQLGQANQLGETLLGDRGLVAKGKQAYNYLTGTKPLPQKPSSGGQATSSSGVPQPMGVKPATTQEQSPSANQENAELSPDAGGVMPRTDVAMDTSITPPDEDILSPSMFANRGGVVPHKASGGHLQEKILPYQSEDPYGVEAVNESESGEKYDLLGDEKGGGSGGGGKKGPSGASMALKGAGALANLIPGVGPFISAGLGAASAFVKDGGRIRPGYQQAGAVTEEGSSNKEYTMDDYLNALSKIESSHNYGALGPRTKSGDRAYGRYQVMGANVPSWTQEHYGQSLSPEEFRANKEAQDAVARGQFGKYLNQYGSPEDAASVWFSGRPMSKAGNASDITGTTVPAYVSKFRSALGLGAAPEVDGGGGDGSEARTPEQRQAQEASGLMPTNFRTGKPFSSIGDFLTDRQFLVPLLSGVGAMAASPSRYFGGALLQGVGAAAQSYGGMEKTQQEIAESQGRTAEYLASAANKSLFSDPVTGVAMVRLATGQTKPLDEWIDTQEELAGGAAAAQAARMAFERKSGQPSTGPTAQAGQAGQAQTAAGAAQPKYQVPVPNGVVFDQATSDRAREDRRMGFGPNAQTVRQTAQDYTKSVNGSANVARQTTPILNEMALNVSNAIQQKGFNAPGTAFSDRAGIVRALNTVANAVGYKGKPFGEADTIDSLSEKFKALQGAAMVAGINQESLGALQAMMSALPNPNMDPDAQAQLAAQMLVLNRKDKDRNIHLQRYNQESRNMPYSAGSAFDEKNSQQYLAAVDLVKDIVKYGNEDLKKMLTGQYKPEQIEKIFQEAAKISGKPYVPGMSRFFTGG